MGSILEVLNIQAALANAQERRIQALTDWYNACVELASKLGRMEIDDAGIDRTHRRLHLSEESHWFER
jgi:outer membrane protein TolC